MESAFRRWEARGEVQRITLQHAKGRCSSESTEIDSPIWLYAGLAAALAHMASLLHPRLSVAPPPHVQILQGRAIVDEPG